MSKYRALFAIIVVIAMLAACTPPEGGIGFVSGSGNLVTREEAFRGFDRIEVGSAFEIDIRQGDSYQVIITVDDNLVSYLDVRQAGSTLHIGLKPFTSVTRGTLRAEVTLPELAGLELSGACRGRMSGFVSSRDLTLGLSGASSLRGDATAGSVRLDASGASSADADLVANGGVYAGVSGASRATLRGSGRDLTLNVSGASKAELERFTVRDADVEVSGASTARVDLTGRLNVQASGASHVYYQGSPTMGRIETSGASSVQSEN